MRHQSGTWNIAKASVQGASHRAIDVECQDVHRAEVTDTGDLVIVVADGAGSAKHARWGAEIAVANVFECVQALLSRHQPDTLDELAGIVERGVRYGYEALLHTANQAAIPIKSLHATLTCVVVIDAGVIVGKIGDGVVVEFHPTSGLETLAKPENGEYVNSTYFLTQLDGGHAQLIGREIPPDAIAVSTDGLLEVGFDQPYGACTPWENFFLPMFTWLGNGATAEDSDAQLAGFLNSDAIQGRCDDDLTLVIATRRSPMPPSDVAGDTEMVTVELEATGDGDEFNPHK